MPFSRGRDIEQTLDPQPANLSLIFHPLGADRRGKRFSPRAVVQADTRRPRRGRNFSAFLITRASLNSSSRPRSTFTPGRLEFPYRSTRTNSRLSRPILSNLLFERDLIIIRPYVYKYWNRNNNTVYLCFVSTNYLDYETITIYDKLWLHPVIILYIYIYISVYKCKCKSFINKWFDRSWLFASGYYIILYISVYTCKCKSFIIYHVSS